LGSLYLRATRRRAWSSSAVMVCLLLDAQGVPGGLGVSGSFHLG
jgi:hypothetical protein